MTNLCVDVVHDQQAFFAMAKEWDALVERAGIDHPFLGHDWVRSWWECFGAGNELWLLTVRAGEDLIALAPLMRTRARVYGLPVSRLEFIANVHTPRCDFIIAERADEVYAAILDYLQAQDLRWDILMLPELAQSSRTATELRRLAESRSLHTGVWLAGASPRILLNESFKDFCAELTSKRRHTLRKRMRRLEQVGKVSMEVVTDLAQLPSAMEDGLRIEAAAWKGDAGTAIASHERVKRFYELLADRAARSETLRLLFLKVDDKRIACCYCLRHGDTLYLLKSGYDPAYAHHSPSNALLFLTVEAAFQDGLSVIDLLGNEAPWKHEWTDAAVERRWLFVYRNTLRAQLIYYLKFVILPRLKLQRVFAAPGEGHLLPGASTAIELDRVQP